MSSQNPTSSASGACPGCGAALTGARCDACGAVTEAGGYRVQSILAQTPHSRTYLALDPQGRKVALKELVFALAPDVKQVETFEREAGLLQSIKHPRVPQFLGSFKEGEGAGLRLYIAQELIEGESLLSRSARGPLSEGEVREIGKQVLETLAYLHSREPKVLHRDVKPANLIARPDGAILLVDFGAARTLSRDVTHGATLVGTFGYMAPEQLAGTVDDRSDLYGLGATLVHLVTGKEPTELLKNGLELSWQKEAAACSAAFKEWLAKATARSPKKRFSTAGEALEALNATAPGEAKPRGKGRALALSAAVGGVAVLAGFAAALLMPKEVLYRGWVIGAPQLASSPSGASLGEVDGSWPVEVFGCVTAGVDQCEVQAHLKGRPEAVRGYLQGSLLMKAGPTVYLWAKQPQLRAEAGPGGAVVKEVAPTQATTQLDRNAEFALVESHDGARGWVPAKWLRKDVPTVALALSEFQATPADQHPDRLRLAQLAVALAPNDPAAHQVLLTAIEGAGDKTALKEAKQALEELQARLEKEAREGELRASQTALVLEDDAHVRKEPKFDSKSIKRLATGDALKVASALAEDPRTGQTWRKAFLDESAQPYWIDAAQIAVPEEESASTEYEEYQEGTEAMQSEHHRLSLKQGVMLSAELRTRVSRHPSPERRAAVAVLLMDELVEAFHSNVDLPGPIDAGELCAIWSHFQADPVAAVREEATRNLIAVAGGEGGDETGIRGNLGGATSCSQGFEAAVRELTRRGTELERQQLKELARRLTFTPSEELAKILAEPRAAVAADGTP